MAFETIIVAQKRQIQIITLNRPHVLNAVNRRMLIEIQEALKAASENSDVRAIVITGAGDKSFVAGADIGEMKSLTPVLAEQFSKLGHQVLDQIGELRVPVIAAVNGYALGGGLEIALACDFAFASENAQFGLVETKLGLIPGFGGIYRLSKRVGLAYAKELIFSGAQINAQEALRIGLVNRVVANGAVLDTAIEIAEQVAKRGPYAVSLAKSVIHSGMEADLHSVNALEQKSFGLIFSTKDQHEGIRAFLEKRPPIFEGL